MGIMTRRRGRVGHPPTINSPPTRVIPCVSLLCSKVNTGKPFLCGCCALFLFYFLLSFFFPSLEDFFNSYSPSDCSSSCPKISPFFLNSCRVDQKESKESWYRLFFWGKTDFGFPNGLCGFLIAYFGVGFNFGDRIWIWRRRELISARNLWFCGVVRGQIASWGSEGGIDAENLAGGAEEEGFIWINYAASRAPAFRWEKIWSIFVFSDISPFLCFFWSSLLISVLCFAALIRDWIWEPHASAHAWYFCSVWC